jgi:biopolymer transport protein ExbD
MPRRKISRQNTEVELFPFLSVLACTIGTLILLIVIMTAQALGNQQKVAIKAKSDEQGENQAKTPHYVECTNKGAIIYPNKQLIPRSRLDENGSPLKKFLTDIKNKGNDRYLIIAVRPDGYDVFKAVRAMAEIQKIDIGYEPIDREWQLEVAK